LQEEAKSAKKGDKKRWIHDPKSKNLLLLPFCPKCLMAFFLLLGDLCGPLNCKKKELCLLEDAFTAACVNKKELQRNGYDIVLQNI